MFGGIFVMWVASSNASSFRMYMRDSWKSLFSMWDILNCSECMCSRQGFTSIGLCNAQRIHRLRSHWLNLYRWGSMFFHWLFHTLCSSMLCLYSPHKQKSIESNECLLGLHRNLKDKSGDIWWFHTGGKSLHRDMFGSERRILLCKLKCLGLILHKTDQSFQTIS